MTATPAKKSSALLIAIGFAPNFGCLWHLRQMNLLIVRAIYQLCPLPITAKAALFMSQKAGVLGKQKQVFRFFSGLATNCSTTNAYFPARNLSLYE